MVRIQEAMVLPQPVSVLMSMACVVNKDHIETWGLDHNLWPWGYLRAVWPPETCWSERPVLLPRVMVSSSGPGLLLRTLSGSMVLQQPGSELMSMTPVTTEGHANGQGLVCYLRPCQTNYFQILLQLVCYLCLPWSVLQRAGESNLGNA